MFNPKSLSAISYLSILFAPCLLPTILWIVSNEKEVKYHAKRATISHSIPTLVGVIISIIAVMSLFSINSSGYNPSFFTFFMVMMFLYFVITLIIVIWNLVQALRIFR